MKKKNMQGMLEGERDGDSALHPPCVTAKGKGFTAGDYISRDGEDKQLNDAVEAVVDGLIRLMWTGLIGHDGTLIKKCTAEVNGDRYRAVITNFFIPELNNHDVQELWFQQDGATCHTARATIDLLKDTFGDRLISRFGPVNWPPRSCDLTALDYFLWGYVKSLVYADKPQTLDHLEGNIRRVIADIRPQKMEKVILNWTSRLDYIRASRGSPIPEIIFQM
ncbi:putative DD41D transposase [Trichonephila clavipes]|nr:putative DD41D transposase [Trichonephila clavipes]